MAKPTGKGKPMGKGQMPAGMPPKGMKGMGRGGGRGR